MTKARTNKQHEYVSLIIEWPQGRLTLTESFSGCKASMKPGVMDKAVFNRVFKAFDKAMNTDGHAIAGVVGVRADLLAGLARNTGSPEAFAEIVEKHLAKGALPTVGQNADEMAKLTPIVSALQNGDYKPAAGEGSGKFIQRMWMSGINAPDALVELVLKHYPGRTTKRSDVAFNVSALRKLHGADKVPAWPK